MGGGSSKRQKWTEDKQNILCTCMKMSQWKPSLCIVNMLIHIRKITRDLVQMMGQNLEVLWEIPRLTILDVHPGHP